MGASFVNVEIRQQVKSLNLRILIINYIKNQNYE